MIGRYLTGSLFLGSPFPQWSLNGPCNHNGRRGRLTRRRPLRQVSRIPFFSNIALPLRVALAVEISFNDSIGCRGAGGQSDVLLRFSVRCRRRSQLNGSNETTRKHSLAKSIPLDSPSPFSFDCFHVPFSGTDFSFSLAWKSSSH